MFKFRITYFSSYESCVAGFLPLFSQDCELVSQLPNIPINKVQVGDKNGKKYVKDRFSVKNIHTTADKTITDLEIVNQRGETVYTYRTASTSRQSIETDQKEEQAEMISDQDIQNLYAELGRTGVTV